MVDSGLVSISFRKLTPPQIIELVARAGLGGIEWGGDVHAPHGDVPRAKEVRRWTVDAGLKVTSYGSYYHVADEASLTFEAVLESAVALGAPLVRVWAGRRGSDDADPAYRGSVVEETRRIADLAQTVGVRIAFEFLWLLAARLFFAHRTILPTEYQFNKTDDDQDRSEAPQENVSPKRDLQFPAEQPPHQE